jgi:chromosomal replication initiator protein
MSVPSAASALWMRCLNRIADQVSRQAFETWFRPTRGVELAGDTLTIEVSSRFVSKWLEENYRPLISRTLAALRTEPTGVSFAVNGTKAPPPPPSPPAPVQTQPVHRTHANGRDQMLSPRYTFETFVRGKGNEFTHAAAQAVAENPGQTAFNPLVIYGGVGLGKTHILQAVGHYARERSRAARIVYVTSEQFTNDFISAIQNGATDRFNERYRTADLLLLDDIQFFPNKGRTQEEFFHTFNKLHQDGKQIMLSSDSPPGDLKGMEERLISRFQWGLVTDIQPPDFETRVAILRKKAELEGVSLGPEVAGYIAERATDNIRELEGSLNRLMVYASLRNNDITLHLAEEALDRVLKAPVRSAVTVASIRQVVSKKLNVPVDLLTSKTRRREVVRARQIAMFLAKRLTDSTLKAIGEHYGGRDHTTVLHACQLMETRRRASASFNEKLESLAKACCGGPVD